MKEIIQRKLKHTTKSGSYYSLLKTIVRTAFPVTEF